MANASRKHFGPAARDHGKGDGTGAMSTLDTGAIPDNMVLSNRDKAQHSDQRGLDGKAVLTEQYRDHAANRRDEEVADIPLMDRAGADASVTADDAAAAGLTLDDTPGGLVAVDPDGAETMAEDFLRAGVTPDSVADADQDQR